MKPELTDIDMVIIRYRYGLNDGRQKTLKQTAKRFHVSCTWMRHLESKALRKMGLKRS